VSYRSGIPRRRPHKATESVIVIVIVRIVIDDVFRAVEYGVQAENINLSAIRTFRVLRPLRAINRIPSKNLSLFFGLECHSSEYAGICIKIF